MNVKCSPLRYFSPPCTTNSAPLEPINAIEGDVSVGGRGHSRD